MPTLTFEISDLTEIYDPTAKSIPIESYFAIRCSSYFLDTNELHIDIFGSDAAAVPQFANQLNVAGDEYIDLDLENEVVVRRIESKHNQSQEEALGKHNLLINIHLNIVDDATPVVVNLEIDPPINEGIRHAYTFSSTEENNVDLTLVATRGLVRGRLYEGDKDVLEKINSLMQKDDDKLSHTDKRELTSKIGNFLEPPKMDNIIGQLAELTKNDHPQVAKVSREKRFPIAHGHLAFIAIGQEGRSKYKLKGRIDRR